MLERQPSWDKYEAVILLEGLCLYERRTHTLGRS